MSRQGAERADDVPRPRRTASVDRASGFKTDTVVALTVSLVYSIAKVGHAIDGRVGIPGGPTVVTDATAGSGEVARQQWVLVALGVVAAMVALSTALDLSQRGVLRVARWVVVSGVALLIVVGAGIIAFSLFEVDHRLRWSQPLAAVVAGVGAWAWLHLASRLWPARAEARE